MSFFLNDYLIANGISIRKRVSDLFDELKKNPQLAQVFIQNPILVLQTKTLPELQTLDQDATNAANQFLFSVLTNDKFIKWLENYQNKLISQYNKNATLPSKKQVLQEFAKSIIENGDPKIVSDLLELTPKNLERLNASRMIEMDFVVSNKNFAIWEYVLFVRISLFVYNYDYLVEQAAGIGKINLIDENQKIVTISIKELKSLSEQIVNHAKKIRAQTEEKKLDN